MLKYLLLIFMISLVAITLYNIVIKGETPLAVVKGNSMLPLLREGDIVIIIKANAEEIKPGDIIVYKAGDKLIIHRVIEIRRMSGDLYFVTKGDNNPMSDFIYFDNLIGIHHSRVVGKVFSINQHVFKIPYLGYLSLMFRNNS
ncbi:MAG: signal peptidase I [Desulfurococcaceae archaeon]